MLEVTQHEINRLLGIGLRKLPIKKDVLQNHNFTLDDFGVEIIKGDNYDKRI